jgi:hypothetical protein
MIDVADAKNTDVTPSENSGQQTTRDPPRQRRSVAIAPTDIVKVNRGDGDKA